MFDLIVRNATLPDGRGGIDLAVSGGRIAAVEPQDVLAAATSPAADSEDGAAKRYTGRRNP
jgi:cytosine deaminase